MISTLLLLQMMDNQHFTGSFKHYNNAVSAKLFLFFYFFFITNKVERHNKICTASRIIDFIFSKVNANNLNWPQFSTPFDCGIIRGTNNLRRGGRMFSFIHGLRTSRGETAFTARPKIQSQSQIFMYGGSIFCLPHRPNFSDIFDLCLHWVSAYSVGTPLPFKTCWRLKWMVPKGNLIWKHLSF